MNMPSFHDREKGFEDEYIKRREQEKFAAKKGQAAVPTPGGQASQGQQAANPTEKK